MSRVYTGAQALVRQKQPLAHYSHCYAHCTNLVALSLADIPLIRNGISMENEIGVPLDGQYGTSD